MARVEEEVDVAALAARELVDRPRGNRWLPQALDLLRLLTPAGVAQLAGEPVALADEVAWVDPVEAVELGVEGVYSCSSAREVVP